MQFGHIVRREIQIFALLSTPHKRDFPAWAGLSRTSGTFPHVLDPY